MNRQLTRLTALAALTLGLSAVSLADSTPPSGSVRVGSDFTKIAINAVTPWTLHYGVPGNWISISGAGMSPIQCEPNTFGRDPAPNVAKSCFLSGAPAQAIVSACAADFGQCAHSGKGTVLYGVYGKMVWTQVDGPGQLACQPSTFGVDPAPNIPKNCFFFPANEEQIGIRISMSSYSGLPTNQCITAPLVNGATVSSNGACSSQDALWSIIDGRLTRVTDKGLFTGMCAHREPMGSTSSFNLVMRPCALDQTNAGAQRGWQMPESLEPAFMPVTFKFNNNTFCLNPIFGQVSIVNCDPARGNLVAREMYVDVAKVVDLP